MNRHLTSLCLFLEEKSDNTNKKSKRLQLQGESREFKTNYLQERRMRGDLIETFEIMKFLIWVNIFFKVFP